MEKREERKKRKAGPGEDNEDREERARTAENDVYDDMETSSIVQSLPPGPHSS